MTLTLHELSRCYPTGNGLGGLGAWAEITADNVSTLAQRAGRDQGIQSTHGCGPLAFAMAGAAVLMLQASQRDYEAQTRFGTSADAAALTGRDKTAAFNYWNGLRQRLTSCEQVSNQRAVVVWRPGSAGDNGGQRVFFINGGQWVGATHQRGVLADPTNYKIDRAGNPVRRATVVAGPAADAPAPALPTGSPPISPRDQARLAMEQGSGGRLTVSPWQTWMVGALLPSAATQATVPTRSRTLTMPEVQTRAAVIARDEARQEAEQGGQFYSGWLSNLFAWTDTAVKAAGGTAPSEERAGFTQAELAARQASRVSRDPATAERARAQEVARQARQDMAAQQAADVRREQDRIYQAALAQSRPRPAVTVPAGPGPRLSAPSRLPQAPPSLRVQANQQAAPPSWLLPVVMVGSVGLLTWVGYSLVAGGGR